MEGTPGAWGHLAQWHAGALVVAVLGQGFWWFLDRTGWAEV